MSDWQSVLGTLDATQFDALCTAVRETLALDPEADGSFDCGTHGCWILEAVVNLPLQSGVVSARATETRGFASYPLLSAIEQLLASVARLPGTEATSWQQVRRRKTVRAWAIYGVILALVMAVGALVLARSR